MNFFKKTAFLCMIALATVVSTNAATTGKGTIKQEKKIVPLFKVMTYTFTDGCGTEWTLTASCTSCTNNDMLLAINNWLASHQTGEGPDGDPCFEN